jgi:hypothetical protein
MNFRRALVFEFCFVSHAFTVHKSPGKYCDIPLGLYVVRGDSIVLMGELDAEKEEKDMKLEKITPQQFADLPEAEGGKIEWDFES